MKKVLSLSFSLFFILVFIILLLGCNRQSTEISTSVIPKYTPSMSWFLVTKLVEASNDSQPLFPTDGGPRQHQDYNREPYFWKSEWNAYFLGEKYSYLGSDWIDMWLVQRRHLSDGVWSTNTNYWLFRESTGKVFFLDWSHYRPENEASLLEQAVKEIKEGTLVPNR
jgi:hypothetical protein